MDNSKLFFRQHRNINSLSEEEAGLALLGEVLDLGLQSDVNQEVIDEIKPNNIIDVLTRQNGNFKMLLDLATNLGLVEELQKMPQVTLFAPSDEAFLKLSSFSFAPQDLKRHVIAVKLPSNSIESGPAFTASGDIVNLIKSSSTVEIQYKNTTVQVVEADIMASNGVIHVIDQVLAD